MNKIFNKAIFNVFVQIIPITVSLIAIPKAISNLGKPIWYFYSLGLTLIILPNYISFGVGPYLTRYLSNRTYFENNGILNKTISFTLYASLFYLFLLISFLPFYGFEKKFITHFNQLIFFFFFIVGSSVYYLTIPLKSILESKQDFYFLGIVRSLVTSLYLIIPVLNFESLWHYSLAIFFVICLQSISYFFRIKYSIFFPLNISYKSLKFDSSNQILKEIWPFGGYLLLWSIFLYSDRFILSLFVEYNILSDHVTMQDLFNRVAIISGNITAVYYPFISKNKENKILVGQIYRKQQYLISLSFGIIIFVSFFFINDILKFWLKAEFSDYINRYSFYYLLGVVFSNYIIIQVRTLHALGYERYVIKILGYFSLVYVFSVFFTGFINRPFFLPIILLFLSIFISLNLHKKYVKEKSLHTI